MDDASPVFDAPGAKRSRKTDERVLGRGQHADVALKLAIVRVHKQIVNGELVIKSKERLPRNNVAKTARIYSSY